MKTEKQQEDVDMPSSEQNNTNQEATVSNNSDDDKSTPEPASKPSPGSPQASPSEKSAGNGMSAFLAISSDSDPRAIAEKRKLNMAVARGEMTQEEADEIAKRPRTPGAFKSISGEVTLRTKLAVSLFTGRRGNPSKHLSPIIGLTRFAKRSVEIWTAAEQDDPYADHVLLHIEEAYDTAKKRLDNMTKDVGSAMEDYLDIDFEDSAMSSKKPTTLQAEFHCSWAWRGLKLVKQFDDLVKLALGGKHIGLYTEEDWIAIVHETGRGIRHMFLRSEYWIYTGIGRENVKADDRFAQEAYEKYVKGNRKDFLILDDDVINGVRRAKLSPKIKGNPRAERFRAMNKLRDKAENDGKKKKTSVIMKSSGKKTTDTGKPSGKKTLKLKKNAERES
ncbi:integrating conjugative element protein [Candidatus Endobugula sertula]|uniref:Integrating conjugative element protein n=1 Tax=Candidatus Endobugula sertula TaxID=62101 RepID=A0A1D2QPT3_9GAMM|nr:integrating conjugative element protein [Candidatus Endobugula sertula]